MRTNYTTSATAAKIAALEGEILALRQLQRAELLASISAVVPPGVAFSARELFAYHAVFPELAAAFDDAGIHSARVLGKRLQQLCGAGLERVGADHDGAIWIVR